MFTFILRRLLYSIPVLIATTFLIFVFVSETSHPLAKLLTNPHITKSEIQAIAHAKHLDESVLVRYGYWVRDAVLHKFGNNLSNGDPVWPNLQRVLGHTLQLLIAVIILSVIIGVLVGVFSALRQYSFFDYGATTLSFLGFAMPVFWLALILQVIFTDIYTRWHVRIFYTAQFSSDHPGNWLLDRVQHLALPVIALTALSTAAYSRYMRASMLEVINSDYARTARAKGLPESRVILRHVFRNALIPLTTQVALDFGALFGGAIVTERVFTLDGMGNYFIQALFDGDPYPIMAWLAVVTVMVIVFNLIADILYGVLDPRIRLD